MKSHVLVLGWVCIVGASGCTADADDNVESNDAYLSSPCGGGNTLQGEIEKKYAALGGTGSLLGCPTSSELPTPDKFGAYNTFQNGSIYWSPDTGAHEVHGAIRDAWGRTGWENGPLGFPTTDESPGRCMAMRYSGFENGAVVWTPFVGARPSYGPVRDIWARNDFECGRLGVPWSEVFYTPVATKIRINALQSFNTTGEAYWQIYTQPNGRTAAIIAQKSNGKWFGLCSTGVLSWYPC